MAPFFCKIRGNYSICIKSKELFNKFLGSIFGIKNIELIGDFKIIIIY